MRSDLVLASAAALHFALAPPQAAGGEVWLHVCGSEALVPLKLPERKDSDRTAPCHGAAALAAEKKKPRNG